MVQFSNPDSNTIGCDSGRGPFLYTHIAQLNPGMAAVTGHGIHGWSIGCGGHGPAAQRQSEDLWDIRDRKNR